MTDYRIDVKIDPSGSRSGRRQVEGDLAAIEGRANRTRSALLRMIPAVSISAALGRATADALNFGDAMAEVSTLLDDVEGNMAQLEQAALDQAAAFGSNPVDQARAQYQIISAGASDAAEATEILTAANRLAVGGVTDVATAADGLTSILNAYGPAVEGAADVSDTLFVGMRAGKTTISELSSSLGRVAPLAAQAGVEFDQLVATTAALTKGGINTREAVTGVRAILAAVVRPTVEAAEEAERLGLNFNAAALQSQGFAGFMQEVVEKTGGSSESMARLFGGVESLIPALALAGQAGVDFNVIMEQMAQRTGATDEAFARIAESDGFKFRQQLAALTVEGIKLGNVLLSIIVPAMQFAAANGELIKATIIGLTAAFVAYRAGLIVTTAVQAATSGTMGILAGMVATATTQFGIFAGVQVAAAAAAGGLRAAINALTVAMLRNPVTLIATGIGILAGAMFLLSNETDAATEATMANAEAQARAAEREAERANIIGSLVNATAAERQETINAMNAAVEKANADIRAARAALTRAAAERDLAAAIAQRANERVQYQMRNTTGAGSGYDPAIGAINRAQPANDALAAANQEVSDIEERIAGLQEERDATLETIRQLEELGNITAPVITPVSTSALDGANSLDRLNEAAEATKTTFADIEAGLEREIELSRLSGVERDIRAEQMRAEADLERELSDEENARIATMIRQVEANRDLIDAQEAYQDGLTRTIADLERDNILLRTNVEERGARAAVLALEAEIGAELLPQDRARIENLYRENEALDAQNRLYEQLTGRHQDIIRDRETLNALYEQGRISLEQFNRELFDLRLDEINERIRDGTASMADGFISELARMSNAARNWKASAGQIFGQFFDQFSQGVGNSIGRAIVYAEDLGASLLEVARNAVASLISSMIQLGLQILINKAIMAAFGAETVATTGVQASALAAAWAPAAAFASLATLGANAGPAIGGIALTVAATKAVGAVAKGFREGGYTGDGGLDEPMGVVHGREFVVNADATAKHRSMLEAINAGRSPTAAPRGTQSSGGGGDQFSISVGEISVSMQSTGDPQADGEAAGARIKEMVLSITAEEMRKQSRNGGALTKNRKSAMAN